jgi:GT2 family glycosyltransferase
MGTRILVLAVNYHSDDTAAAWAREVSRALQPVRAAATVVVVDNTPRENSEDFFARLRAVDREIVGIKAPGNLGYFGGAHHGWEEWLRRGGRVPDWVMVSNVDVGFANQEFFTRLLSNAYPADTGVVGPSLCSEGRHGDWNPKILLRPTRRQMHAYKLLYRSRWLYILYAQMFRAKHALTGHCKRSAVLPAMLQEIYAPHGACILFSREYFVRGGNLSYPGFLFGEEVFVAEAARRLALKVLYDPGLQMTSQDHVSTGRFPSKRMVQYMHESAVILADRYFP